MFYPHSDQNLKYDRSHHALVSLCRCDFIVLAVPRWRKRSRRSRILTFVMGWDNSCSFEAKCRGFRKVRYYRWLSSEIQEVESPFRRMGQAKSDLRT